MSVQNPAGNEQILHALAAQERCIAKNDQDLQNVDEKQQTHTVNQEKLGGKIFSLNNKMD